MDIDSDSLSSGVPTWPEFLKPVLEVLSSGQTYHRRELIDRAAEVAHLGDAARAERLNSGGLRYVQRMGWTLSHLSRAGLIDRPRRAHYAINDAGRAWLAEHPEGMNYSTAHTFFSPYWRTDSTKNPDTAVAPDVEALDPLEKIDQGIEQLHVEVGEELLTRLRESHPDFFEEAVVRVLLRMGYGGAEARGQRIGGSGDGGVDGVIDQDPLGLDQIYVQAKRYAEGNTVGREAIQAFVGALHGRGASKGIFITTSAFTQGAKEYAGMVPSRPILIDGARLVKLMLKYKVGVQVKQTYEIVDVDEDFFEGV
ncbi:restriction endonuclease [Kocuria turfanensis]|uniref:Restriction endonuclease n=1 Tax=Kocuria turfanensis TaxID=388357 RepID=A0A512IH62_9MICC|nr:restriction endonuclease [Kocuria turfanensis]GEO96988.1 restriction endonuclease [Kocuria turfanensis]